jgi:hypothetical protein
VYSLGVIAHEALVGARPAAGARRASAVPARLLALLERMVAHDPLVRPTSAEVRAEALAIVEQIEMPLPPHADDDVADVQIEDVELGFALAAELEPEPPTPTTLPAGSLTWASAEADPLAGAKTMPPEAAIDPARDPARTPTESMLAEHLARTKTVSMMPEQFARTKTEPMLAEHLAAARAESQPAEPEPRVGRTSTRIVKLAPSRVLARSSTKPH